MARLNRRITVSALHGAANGTTITDANTANGLVVPQAYVSEIWLRQVDGVDIDWRLPAVKGNAQDTLTIPGGESGLIDGVSMPGDVELFLPSGQATPVEVQVALIYPDL